MKGYKSNTYYTARVRVDTNIYEIICIPEVREPEFTDKVYAFYIQPLSREHAAHFTFGLPADKHTLDEAFEIAKRNAKTDVRILYETYWQ